MELEKIIILLSIISPALSYQTLQMDINHWHQSDTLEWNNGLQNNSINLFYNVLYLFLQITRSDLAGAKIECAALCTFLPTCNAYSFTEGNPPSCKTADLECAGSQADLPENGQKVMIAPGTTIAGDINFRDIEYPLEMMISEF